jgi:rhodanese-related sulfurtransferase
MINLLKRLFGTSAKPDLKLLIDEGAYLVDVRTPQEHAQSKVKGSVNIPLDSMSNHLAKFKDRKHIIVFCRSGNRSSQAKSILERNGFSNVVNGGTSDNVKQFVK